MTKMRSVTRFQRHFIYLWFSLMAMYAEISRRSAENIGKEQRAARNKLDSKGSKAESKNRKGLPHLASIAPALYTNGKCMRGTERIVDHISSGRPISVMVRFTDRPIVCVAVGGIYRTLLHS